MQKRIGIALVIALLMTIGGLEFIAASADLSPGPYLSGPNVKDRPGWKPVASAIPDADGFVSLFDGKTFNGWEGNAEVWRIENSCLAGGGRTKSLPESEYLCTRLEFGDFELRLQFKAVPTQDDEANGGIQIRSRRLPESKQVIGYQADLGVFKNFPPGKFWGCLFDNARRNRILAGDPVANEKYVKKGDWNDYVIRCEGRRVQLWLNGQPTVDYTESDEALPRMGIIGLQCHSGPPQEMWYKNIRIKEIPETK